jgi:hypothetical protein
LAPKPSAPGKAGRKFVAARDELGRCAKTVRRIRTKLKTAVGRKLEVNNCLKVKSL